MGAIIGEFRIGEDLSVALDAVSGASSAVTAIAARMKPAISSGNRFRLDDAAIGQVMTVSPQTPASAGWIVSLTSAATSALAVGVYGIDARLEMSGAVEMTEQTAFIRLTKAAVA